MPTEMRLDPASGVMQTPHDAQIASVESKLLEAIRHDEDLHAQELESQLRWLLEQRAEAVAEVEHPHVLEQCKHCESKHCRCLTCEVAGEFMHADDELLAYAIG